MKQSWTSSFSETAETTIHAAHRAAQAAGRLAQLTARRAHLPKACFLGVTAVASLLFALLASLSQN